MSHQTPHKFVDDCDEDTEYNGKLLVNLPSEAMDSRRLIKIPNGDEDNDDHDDDHEEEREDGEESDNESVFSMDYSLSPKRDDQDDDVGSGDHDGCDNGGADDDGDSFIGGWDSDTNQLSPQQQQQQQRYEFRAENDQITLELPPSPSGSSASDLSNDWVPRQTKGALSTSTTASASATTGRRRRQEEQERAESKVAKEATVTEVSDGKALPANEEVARKMQGVKGATKKPSSTSLLPTRVLVFSDPKEVVAPPSNAVGTLQDAINSAAPYSMSLEEFTSPLKNISNQRRRTGKIKNKGKEKRKDQEKLLKSEEEKKVREKTKDNNSSKRAATNEEPMVGTGNHSALHVGIDEMIGVVRAHEDDDDASVVSDATQNSIERVNIKRSRKKAKKKKKTKKNKPKLRGRKTNFQATENDGSTKGNSQNRPKHDIVIAERIDAIFNHKETIFAQYDKKPTPVDALPDHKNGNKKNKDAIDTSSISRKSRDKSGSRSKFTKSKSSRSLSQPTQVFSRSNSSRSLNPPQSRSNVRGECQPVEFTKGLRRGKKAVKV